MSCGRLKLAHPGAVSFGSGAMSRSSGVGFPVAAQILRADGPACKPLFVPFYGDMVMISRVKSPQRGGGGMRQSLDRFVLPWILRPCPRSDRARLTVGDRKGQQGREFTMDQTLDAQDIAVLQDIEAVQQLLAKTGYVCGRDLATVVFLSLRLGRPLFLEGEAGVGKTEIAKALATSLGRPLIRLQCYEGLDTASAVYDWNFAAQMVAIRTAEATGQTDRSALQAELFSADYLIERPLLQAMRGEPGRAPVLLIDEIDRTDEPFEAFLLEALSDFQVTIPELGPIRAAEPPIVVLTSNRTREVHDALKRRCLYHWVGYPSFDRELEILAARVPDAGAQLSREIVGFVQRLRGEDLFKKPGMAEALDWARCLLALDVIAMSPEVVSDTLGALLKYQDDIAKIQGSEAARLLGEVQGDKDG